jgi:pimeloyl-ACP methyl ester carboxylesterase
MRRAAPATQLTVIDGQPIEYRLEGGESETVALILHGGHMSAACRFGEETFLDLGLGVLVASRPGYGRTAAGAGPSTPEFVGRLAGLCRQLGVLETVAVGISLGARSAMTLAAFYPDLVGRVVLMCPTSFRVWPDARARALAQLMFNPVSERGTWGVVHQGLRRNPARFLPIAMASLSTLSPQEAVQRLGDDRDKAIDFLLSCRAGRGFMLDFRTPTDISADVGQPTLILATHLDGSVGLDHPEHLVRTLADARLVDVGTPSHLLWLGEGSERTRQEVQTFLRS